MAKTHHYDLSVTWTGNTGKGTLDYRAYERNNIITTENKADIPGSSDSAFRGDATRYNPEELFLASISACHMLWYLHLCADEGIIVTAYTDHATGTMEENNAGGARFTEVILHPAVTVTDEWMLSNAARLHRRANELCYIASSCNFPIQHRPVFDVKAI